MTGKKTGFALLYAILLTSVVLLVGVSLMNILTKQIIYSSLNQNSQVAYYAANAGRECLLFNHKNHSFVNSNQDPYTGDVSFSFNESVSIQCAEVSLIFNLAQGENNIGTYTTNNDFNFDGTSAKLTITENLNKYEESEEELYNLQDCLSPDDGETFTENCESMIKVIGSSSGTGEYFPRTVLRTAITVK